MTFSTLYAILMYGFAVRSVHMFMSLHHGLGLRPKSLTLGNEGALPFPSLNHDLLPANDVDALAGSSEALA